LLTCWLLLLEEYGVKFDYLQGKKIVTVDLDDLSHLDIDSLKIQEEEEVRINSAVAVVQVTMTVKDTKF
jgi:hypothetical protein